MRPKKVLLCIDANPVRLSVSSFVFETRGYHVLATSSQEEALLFAQQGGVDVVICEYGSASVEALKAHAPHAPIVLTSRARVGFPTTLAEAVFAGRYQNEELLSCVKVLAKRKTGPMRGKRTSLHGAIADLVVAALGGG